MATLSTIFTYPIKSFPGIAHRQIELSLGEGLPNDRRYAISNGTVNTSDGSWVSCRSFFINTVNDGLLKFTNESNADTLTLASPTGMRLSWNINDPDSLKFANSKMAEFIAPLQPAGDLPTPQISERTQLPGMLSGYWDFDDSGISLMNANSLKAVADAMKETLDIRRLRGNLIVDGLPAWQEFSWVGQSVRIGAKGKGAEFDVLRPVQRCPATSVNPETGVRDIKVPDGLTEHFGHAFCGVYLKVTKPGVIRQTDPVEVIGKAKSSLQQAANPADTDYRLWPKQIEVVSRNTNGDGVELTIAKSDQWPLPPATPGQRIRFHIDQDLIAIAQVKSHADDQTILHIEPSQTSDPATAYLLEKVMTGDKLIVTGPFGRG